ncbi:MAG: hypoxanthine phosphoribosyltransferase [Deltaproteobacteria bacterium]|jgi:hypoxanthine phosphoribosyltransferase
MGKKVLISRKAIDRRVKELADKISSDYRGKEPILVGILKGSIFFYADLAREMKIPVKLDFIRAFSYGAETHSSGSVQFTKDVELPVEGKDIIIVEDIVDTGLTLTKIRETLMDKGASSFRICALIDKPERRKRHVTIDYCGFEIPEGFIVGYGLDYDEQYRNLPEIYLLT